MHQLQVMLAGIYSYNCCWWQIQQKHFFNHVFDNWIKCMCNLKLGFTCCWRGLQKFTSTGYLCLTLILYYGRNPGSNSCVGIQKHFMGAEIRGFGLPNKFFGLTMSCFFRDGIVNWFTIKLNNLDLLIVLLLRIKLKDSECQSELLTSKLPRQY